MAAGLGTACAVALAVADLPLPLRLVTGLLVLLRLGRELYGQLSMHDPARVLRLAWLPGGRWQLETPAGPAPARLVHRWGHGGGPVLAMEWVCEDGRQCRAWVWRHRCPPRQWRRLRVHLRLA